MASAGSNQISFAESVNRGLNLFVVTLLGITALAFGSDLFPETDSVDKIDNSLLVVIGVVAVGWYFMRRNWGKRSSVPILLAAAAVVAQIVGFVIEIGDSTALGDDIPGMIVFVTGLILAVLVYRMNGQYLAAPPASGGST